MGDDHTEDPKNGKIIKFPDGRTVSSEEIGADYVVSSSNNVPTPEIIDPKSLVIENSKREQYVNSQELTILANNKSSSNELLDSVLKEIALELSHLKWERQKAAKDGKNTANYTINRIAALKQLSEVIIKRQDTMRAEKLDLSSPRFQNILNLWMEFVYDSMSKAGMGQDDIDLVFNTMKADMAGWEKKLLDNT